MNKRKPLARAIQCMILSFAAADIAYSDSFALEEVVVTARKITENMQDVPVAVNSLTSEDIKALNVQNSQDVLIYTPGAEFTTGNPDKPGLSIRGIESGGRGTSVDTGVLVMEDGEVVSRAFMQVRGTFDVQRVEVLRGPQGTTYGRNATGGVVNFINNRPTEEFEAAVTTNVGSQELFSVEGFVSGPVTSGVTGRVSGIYSNRDGYSEDAETGDSLDDEETYSVRGRLQIDIDDTLSVLLTAHGSHLEEDYPLVRKNAEEDEPMVVGLGDNIIYVYEEKSEDPWRALNTKSDYELDVWGGSVEIQKEFEGINLFSLTAYRHGENDALVDLFGTPVPIVMEKSENEAHTWSQELRLDNSPSAEEFGWQVGLYYLYEDSERAEIKPILPGTEYDSFHTIDNSNETNSYGVFSEVTYDFTDSTRALVGARYSRDEKDGFIHNTAGGELGFVFVDDPSQPVIASPDHTWDAVSGKVSITHHFTDTIMGYVSWASGYKSGGFNGEASNYEVASSAFDEETVETIEIGVKTDLFDRVRLNVIYFESDYDDIHGDFFLDNGGNITDNVGDAEISGFEVESLVLITENLRLQTNLANYDSEYVSYDAGSGLAEDEVLGNTVQGAPDWTATVALMYDLNLDSGAVISFRGGYRGRGDVTSGFTADSDRTRESLNKYNAQIAYLSADDVWGLTVWGRNLTDKEEENFYTAALVFLSQGATSYRMPRTYGLTLDYRF